VDTLTRFCRRFAAGEFPGISGMSISARRDSDLTGVVLEVTFSPGRRSDKDGMSYDSHISLSNATSLGSSGSRSSEHLAGRDGWKDELRHLQKLISSPPDSSFEAYFSIGRSE
jgi:hypothetical protein